MSQTHRHDALGNEREDDPFRWYLRRRRRKVAT